MILLNAGINGKEKRGWGEYTIKVSMGHGPRAFGADPHLVKASNTEEPCGKCDIY